MEKQFRLISTTGKLPVGQCMLQIAILKVFYRHKSVSEVSPEIKIVSIPFLIYLLGTGKGMSPVLLSQGQ